MTDSEKLDLLLSEIKGIKNDTVELKGSVSNIEEKVTNIEERVTNIEGEIADLKDRVTGIEGKVIDIEGEVTDLKGRVIDIEGKVTEIELTLENEISVNIKRIAEGHFDLSRNLHDALKIDNEKEMISIRVTTLENEVRRLKQRIDQTA